MRTRGRSAAEILADAVDAVGLPAEACGGTISRCMTALRDGHDRDAGTPSPAAMKDIWRDRVTALRKARAVLVAMRSPAEFIEAFDGQILVATRMRDGLIVPRGSRPVDLTAAAAAIMARDILREFGVPARKTVGGPWYRLSSLLYEAATDLQGEDLSKYCREADKLPRLTHRYIIR